MEKGQELTAEELLCKEVEEQFKRLQKERKSLERGWELNLNFVNGNQYCTVAAGEITSVDKTYDWEQRRVFNHIAPIVDTRLSKLSRIRPALAVRAASDEEDDRKASSLASAILSAVQEECDLDGIMSEATMWSEICGTAFYKIIWNSGGGKQVGATESGTAVKDGEVKICAVSPFEIYPASLSEESLENQTALIHAKILPVESIADMYGVELAGRDISEFRRPCAGSKFTMNDEKLNAGSNFELVLERYMRSSSANHEGRLTVVAGGKLLYDGALPYVNGADGMRCYPFVKQTSLPSAGSFFGSSVVERLIPLQRAYNAVKNRRHEYLNRISMGTVAVEDGSVDVDELTDGGLAPGKVIIYRQGGTPPEMLTLGNVPDEFWKEEESLLAEFTKISGTGDLSENADSFAGVTSATGLQLILEQDDARLNMAYQSLKRAVKNIGRQILRLYRQFATDVRLMRYAGKDGRSQMIFFKGSDISGDDVVLDADTDLNMTPAQRKAVIYELIDRGLFSDENGRMSARAKTKILEALGYASFANVIPEDSVNEEEKDKYDN